MSGSEFPLTLLLQVQDDMSSQLDSVTSRVQGLEGETQNLQSTAKTTGTSFVSLGLGIAAAASGIINLVHQYHNLQRAQTTEEASKRRVENAQRRYNAAVKAHGKNSDQAKTALNNLKNAEARFANQQVALNDRMTDFAFSIVPSVIGVVAGLSQVFQTFGGNRGLAGLGSGLLKFGGILVVIGGALFAFKTNLFGFRDAVNQIGVAIGNAIPQLKPFLNFLSSVATLLGLQGGNKKAAKKFVNNFVDGIKEAFSNVKEKIMKIISKLFSGDIGGAIKQISLTVTNFANSIVIDGTPLPQLPTRIKNHITNILAQHKGDLVAALPDIVVDISNIVLGKDATTKINTFIHTTLPKAIMDNFKTLSFADFQAQMNDPNTKHQGLFFDVINAAFGTDFNLNNTIKPWFDEHILAPISDTWFTKILPAIQEIITNPGKILDIAQGFLDWANKNILTPIVNIWQNNIQPGIAKFLQKNPIFAKVALAVSNIRSIIDTKIVAPILSAIEQVKSMITQNPTFQFLAKLVNDPVGTIMDLINKGKQQAQSNIDKFNKNNPLKNGSVLKSLMGFGGGPEIGERDLAPGVNNMWVDQNGTLHIGGIPGNNQKRPSQGNKFLQFPISQNTKGNGQFGGFGSDAGFGNFNVGQEGGPLQTAAEWEKAATQIQQALTSIAATSSATFNGVGANAVSGAAQVTAAFSPVFIQISAGFTGLANTVSVVMNSFGANARSGAQQMMAAMASFITKTSAGFSGLASTWSAVCNSFGANAKSGASQIISAMTSMASKLSSIFNKIASQWSSTMNKMVSTTKSAVSKIQSSLNSIKAPSVTVHVGVSGPGVKFLASGFHGVVNKPTLFIAGEAGAERVDVSPTSTSSGIGMTAMNRTMNINPSVARGAVSKSMGDGGGGSILVQVFLDGEQVRGKIVQAIVKGQAGYR